MVAVAAWDAPRPQCPLCVRVLIAILIVFLPGLSSVLYAQAAVAPVRASVRPAASAGAAPEASEVSLLVGRSTVLDVAGPISRVSLTSPEVADAMVTTPSQVLIHGKTVGSISMFVWDRGGGIRRYEVVVHRDMSQLESQFRELFPGEPISVAGNGKNVVLSGNVSSKYVMDKAADVAVGYVEKKENVVNLLQQLQAVSNQVLLRVRFAEVSRTALTELGSSYFTGATGYKDYIARATTQQFPAPSFSDLARTEVNGQVTNLDGKSTFSDFLNLFLFNTKYNVGALIKVLQTRGVFQSLAEPNLIAQNGTEASFLAGGEYPYPVVQGQGGGTSVTIQFKEFGIKLNFTPTVLGGDLIHLKVRPEVSALDFTNAISIQGFRVPSLSTRRAETELELRDGQTFAIAGLLNNNLTSTMQKIPGIGDIPILGLLFKSRAARKEQTELVVMITPQILQAGAPGAAPGLPGLIDPFLAPAPNTIPPPPPYGGPGSPRASATPVPQDNARSSAPVASSAQPGTTPTTATSAAPTSAAPVKAGVPPPPPAKATREEREAMERARQEEQKRQQAEAALRAAEQKRAAEQAQLDAQRAAEEQKRAAAQSKIDAQRDAEEQKRAAAQAQVDAQRDAEEQKRAAAQAKIDAQRADEAARRQQELDREQAKQKAEADRRAAEARKRQDEAERKRGQALAEAEARLKAAQTAYQEQLKRSATQNQ